MLGYHVVFEASTLSERPASSEALDRAGGMLAINGPVFSFNEHGPELSVTVYVEEDGAISALASAFKLVWPAFGAVDEALRFRSATVYTETEFDRVHKL